MTYNSIYQLCCKNRYDWVSQFPRSQQPVKT